jgi:hypothetical protein
MTIIGSAPSTYVRIFHASQAKLPSPIARKSSGCPSHKLRLSEVAQVPQSLLRKGLSAPMIGNSSAMFFDNAGASSGCVEVEF